VKDRWPEPIPSRAWLDRCPLTWSQEGNVDSASREPARAARLRGTAGDSRADRDRAPARRSVAAIHGVPGRSGFARRPGIACILSLPLSGDGLSGRHRTDIGRLLRIDLGLRRLLRGALQWPDSGQASDGDSRRFGTGRADQRCAGGLAQPGRNSGRPDSLFFICRPWPA
jgi:hypothetical protein